MKKILPYVAAAAVGLLAWYFCPCRRKQEQATRITAVAGLRG